MTSSSQSSSPSFWGLLCKGIFPTEIIDLFSGKRCVEQIVVDAYISSRDFLSHDTSLIEVMARWATSVVSIATYWLYSIFYWSAYWVKFWASLLLLIIPQLSQITDFLQNIIETFLLEWLVSGPTEDTESRRPEVLLVTNDPGSSYLARSLRETSLRKRVHLRGIVTAASAPIQDWDDVNLVMVDCVYTSLAQDDPVKFQPAASAKAARCKFVLSAIQELITLASAHPSNAPLPRVMFVCDDDSSVYITAAYTLVRATLGPRVELECATYNSLKQKLPQPYSYKQAARRIRAVSRKAANNTPRGDGLVTDSCCSGRDTPTSIAASLEAETELTFNEDNHLHNHMLEEIPSLPIRSLDGSGAIGRKHTASFSSPSTSSTSPAHHSSVTEL